MVSETEANLNPAKQLFINLFPKPEDADAFLFAHHHREFGKTKYSAPGQQGMFIVYPTASTSEDDSSQSFPAFPGSDSLMPGTIILHFYNARHRSIKQPHYFMLYWHDYPYTWAEELKLEPKEDGTFDCVRFYEPVKGAIRGNKKYIWNVLKSDLVDVTS
jgi:hypothetical protein